MNTILGTIKKKGKKIVLDAPSLGVIDLTKIKSRLPSAEMEAVLGIRPEHLLVSQEKAMESDVTLEAEIVVGEVIGSDTILHMKAGQWLMQSFVPRIERMEPGSKVFVSFGAEDVYLFDQKTEKLIA